MTDDEGTAMSDQDDAERGYAMNDDGSITILRAGMWQIGLCLDGNVLADQWGLREAGDTLVPHAYRVGPVAKDHPE